MSAGKQEQNKTARPHKQNCYSSMIKKSRCVKVTSQQQLSCENNNNKMVDNRCCEKSRIATDIIIISFS